MRSSLRRFHRLRELAQLARFIGRAPDTHAFQQLDVAQAALVASWRALLQSGQILPFDAVGFQAYSENEEDGILLYIFTVRRDDEQDRGRDQLAGWPGSRAELCAS